jgi:hypothetical protein
MNNGMNNGWGMGLWLDYQPVLGFIIWLIVKLVNQKIKSILIIIF